MNYAENFKTELMSWLYKNGFYTVESLEFDSNFKYNLPEHIIYIGIKIEPDISDCFEKYLDGLNFQFEDVPAQVLAFLHELGHSQTIYDFSQDELMSFYFEKVTGTIIIDSSPEKEEQAKFKYWNVADERAANEWLVNFTNTHTEAFFELCALYTDCWNALCAHTDVYNLIN